MFVGSKMKYLFKHRHSSFDLFSLIVGIVLYSIHGVLVGVGFLVVAGLVSVVVDRRYND